MLAWQEGCMLVWQWLLVCTFVLVAYILEPWCSELHRQDWVASQIQAEEPEEPEHKLGCCFLGKTAWVGLHCSLVWPLEDCSLAWMVYYSLAWEQCSFLQQQQEENSLVFVEGVSSWVLGVPCKKFLFQGF